MLPFVAVGTASAPEMIGESLERGVDVLGRVRGRPGTADLDLHWEVKVDTALVGDSRERGLGSLLGPDLVAPVDDCEPGLRYLCVVQAGHGIFASGRSFGSAIALRLKPLNVACGAPVGVAVVGCALVMMQLSSTTRTNAQSWPSLVSCSVTLNGVRFIASAVSSPTIGPIALTVSENVIVCGEKIAPMCVCSIECSASAVVPNVGEKLSIGEIVMSWPETGSW